MSVYCTICVHCTFCVHCAFQVHFALTVYEYATYALLLWHDMIVYVTIMTFSTCKNAHRSSTQRITAYNTVFQENLVCI